MDINSYKFLENEKTKNEHIREKLAAVLNSFNDSENGFFNGRKKQLLLYQGTQQRSGMFPLQIMKP